MPKPFPPRLDHLVLAVPDLAAGCAWFEALTSVKPVPGGRHPAFGTRNALVRLGARQYLELLAVDADTDVPAPRWMGVDAVATPTLTRWAARSTGLAGDAERLQAFDARLGTLAGGQRTRPDGSTLAWRLTLPTAAPTVEVVPFLIDWSGSAAHPTDALPVDCTLLSLRLQTPQRAAGAALFSHLGLAVDVETGPVAAIHAVLDTPRGRVEL